MGFFFLIYTKPRLFYSKFTYNEYMDDKYELSIYENMGATLDVYIKEMSSWAKRLEREGKIAHTWCIQDNRIQVIGDVNLGDEPIRYPFGVVGGFFECKDEYKKSPNYPTYIGEKYI